MSSPPRAELVGAYGFSEEDEFAHDNGNLSVAADGTFTLRGSWMYMAESHLGDGGRGCSTDTGRVVLRSATASQLVLTLASRGTHREDERGTESGPPRETAAVFTRPHGPVTIGQRAYARA